MAKHVVLYCMLILLMDSLMRTDGLPTDIAAKPINGPCPNGPLQCFRCVTPAEYTGPCGCPMCADPCQGIMCAMCVPAETVAVRTSPIRPLPGNCCPPCG